MSLNASAGKTSSTSETFNSPGTGLSKAFSDWLEKSGPELFKGLSNAQQTGNAIGSNAPTAHASAGDANPFGNLDQSIIDALKTGFGGPTSYDAGSVPGMSEAIAKLTQNAGDLGHASFTGDTDYYKAVSDVLNNKQRMDIADTRSRFANTGISRGTPGAWAESLLRSQQAPEIAQALGAARQTEVGNQINMSNLNMQGILGGLNAFQGFRGQDINNEQQNISNSLSAHGIDIQALTAALNGQNTFMSNLGSYNTANRGIDADVSKFNAGSDNDMSKFLNEQSLQALLALLSSGVDLSKMGFNSQTKSKGTQIGASGSFGKTAKPTSV